MPTTASAPLSPLDMNRARSQHQPSAFPNQASKTDGADAIGANRHDKPSMGIAQPTSDGRAWNDAALVPSPSPSSTTTASSAIWTPPMNLPRARIDSKFPTDGLPLSRTAMAHAPSPNGDASRYHNPAITIDVPSERGGRGGSADVAPSARSSLSSWMPTSKRTARDDRSSVQSIRSIRSRISHHSPSPAPAEHAKRKDIQGEKDAEDADLEQCLPDPALLGVDDDDVDLPPNMESDERSAGVKLGNAGQSGSALKDREDDFAEALGTSSGKLTRTVTLLSSESDDPVSSPYNLFFGENVPSWIVHLTALMNGDKTNRWSRPLNFFLLAVLLLSILSLCLGTVASIASRLSQELFAVDTACIIVFTIEYLARVLVAQSAAELVSPMHLIDLVSIVPFWVELGIASHLGGGLVDRVTTTNGVSALRAMRLLRTFRLIKFIRRSAKLRIVIEAIRQSVDGVFVLFATLGILVVVLSCVLFYGEQPYEYFSDSTEVWYYYDGTTSPFQSIPSCFYYILGSLTGSPPAVPRSPWGQIVIAVAMLSSIFVVAFPLTIITISYSKTIRTFTARQREKREQKLRRRAEQRARDEEERARFLFSNPLNRTGTFKSQRVNDAVDTAGKEGKEDRRPRDGVPLETSHTLHSDETIAPNPTSATGPPHDESDEEHHIGPRGLIALRDSPPPQPVTPMFNTKFAATATVLKAVKALKGLSHSHPHSHSHSSFLSLHDDAPLEPRGSELAQRFTASPDGVPGTVEVRIVDWCYRGKGSVAGEEGEEGESEAFMGMPGSELRGRNDTLTVRVAVKDADHFARVMRALGEA